MENDREAVASIDDKQLKDQSPNHHEENPDEGPTMTQGGAMPSGSEMAHWNTAMARPDATDPDTMPNTPSKPFPGETNHASRSAV